MKVSLRLLTVSVWHSKCLMANFSAASSDSRPKIAYREYKRSSLVATVLPKKLVRGDPHIADMGCPIL